MKTIFKNGVYDRVNEEVAESSVKYNGWKYVPKSEWKAVSEPPMIENIAAQTQAEKKEKTLSKKAQRRISLKEKQRQ